MSCAQHGNVPDLGAIKSKVRDENSKHFLNESLKIPSPGSHMGSNPELANFFSKNLCSSYLVEMSEAQTSAPQCRDEPDL